MRFKISTHESVLIAGTWLSTLDSVQGSCKASLGSPSWPSLREWNQLNSSISGALIKSTAPAAACHPDQPDYNAEVCSKIQAAWKTWPFHTSDPVSVAYNNWNNDTCIPDPQAPCSTDGYPAYVVNATSAEQVAKAVNFARSNNIRLNVKGSGHDFLGRSTAPNTLSIWTRHLKGIKIEESFKAEGPSSHVNHNVPTLTVGAGVNHGEAFAEANKHGLMIHVAGAPTVSFGGYITGGGHSLLSSKYGLAADAALQFEVVTPDGKIRTVNECNNPDLFWALRGGGGGTFGVITEITFQAFPSEPLTQHLIAFVSITNASAPLVDLAAYAASLYPDFAENGLMAYSLPMPGSAAVPALFAGLYMGVGLSSSRAAELLAPLEQWVNATHPTDIVMSKNVTEYAAVYDFWSSNPDMQTTVGIDQLIGSRLLDAAALRNPNFKELAVAANFPTLFLVSGPGVHSKKTDFNAVSPSWRTAYVHSVEGASWTPLDKTQQKEKEHAVTYEYTKALSQLAPNGGAYVNEANAFEPNFQQVFWGNNYPRLLAIKRKIDPTDLLWCRACVGNERWEEVGYQLCQV